MVSRLFELVCEGPNAQGKGKEREASVEKGDNDAHVNDGPVVEQ